MKFERCVTSLNNKVVPVEENGKKCIFNNPHQTEIRKIKFDKCLIPQTQQQLSCDYGIWVDLCNKCYFIELKGKDIKHACNQLVATINYVRENYDEELVGMEVIAAIVPSANSIPNLKQSPEYLKLKKMVNSVKNKNKILEIDI